MKNVFNEKSLIIVYVLFMIIIAVVIAIVTPANGSPDEEMKIMVSRYIAENNSLPNGFEESVREPNYGTSYAFTPILSYIIGSVFLKIVNLFTQSIQASYVAVRMVSVLCYAIMTVFVIKISGKIFKEKKLYKWLFIVFVTLLPQVTFIGSYINNDSIALMSISIIIYAWLKILDEKLTIKNCILLGVGLGICALSYYNAYGFILTSLIFFVVYALINKIGVKEFFKKGLIIFFITMLICSWWFIRNAIIYDGDFLGLRSSTESAEKYAIDGLKPSIISTPQKENMTVLSMLINKGWILSTIKSFIAVFGYMTIKMDIYVYITYGVIFILGIIGAVIKRIKERKNITKNNVLINFLFIINIIIPIILSVQYSYVDDYQPQGRYIMPMLIPFMYFVSHGITQLIDIIKYKKLKNIITVLLITTYTVFFAICIVRLITEYI